MVFLIILCLLYLLSVIVAACLTAPHRSFFSLVWLVFFYQCPSKYFRC
jgi:hypothetical protein